MPVDDRFYRMPAFVTLAVSDMEKSIRWYQEQLNFELVFAMPLAGAGIGMAHLRYSRFADLMLLPSPVDGPRGLGMRLTFSVFEGSVRDIADALSVGRCAFEGPVETLWNTREVVVKDPDGFVLVFTEPVDRAASIEAVMESVQGTAGIGRHQG